MVRGSLGNVDLSSGVTTSYPLFAMPVPTLLSLEQWEPHQDLKAAGKVIEMTAEKLKETDVIFVSHQWVAFNHPDPAGEQLRCLQKVLKDLIDGVHQVESNFMLNVVYQTRDVLTKENWKEKLPKMHVWFDYISIPQPGAVMNKVSDTLKNELDTNKDGDISKSEMMASTADHRQLKGDDATVMELIEQLKAAVESIPSYIERCSMLWILVPPVKHCNIGGAVCDFNSWRNRGWCRMEFAAGKLASGEDMPIMVIKSTDEAPEFFNPWCVHSRPYIIQKPRRCHTLLTSAPCSRSQRHFQALRGTRQLFGRRRPQNRQRNATQDARKQGQGLRDRAQRLGALTLHDLLCARLHPARV